MDARHAITSVGTGVTAGLVVTVLVVLSLDFEFSALVGVPVGVLAGLVVVATVWVAFDDLSPDRQRALSASAAFGPTALALAGLNYVHLAGGLVTGSVAVGAGLAASVLTYLGLWGIDRRRADHRRRRQSG